MIDAGSVRTLPGDVKGRRTRVGYHPVAGVPGEPGPDVPGTSPMPDEDQTRILRGRPTPVSPPPGPKKPGPADPPEDATRVLTAQEAALLIGAPADKIVFTCPNGHRIVVGAHLAGKRGKCSKCGVDVQIPGGESAAHAPPAPPPVVPGPPAEAADDEEPAAAGEEPAVGWDFVGGGAGEEPIPPVGEEPLLPVGEEPLLSVGEEPLLSVGEEAGDWPAIEAGGPYEEGANPTAHLVARLWAERQHGGVIELHLAGGSVILPTYFDPAWSRGSHGLFAREEMDGSYTLTAVAWDTVHKVVVRQLAAMPPDMFP